MEDALVQKILKLLKMEEKKVLILVLMEDALVHEWIRRVTARGQVLILVLMEDALVR